MKWAARLLALAFGFGAGLALVEGLHVMEQRVVEQQIAEPARGALRLTCTKCTREARILADSREDAWAQSVRAGWLLHNGRVVCPKCPAPRGRQ